MLKQLKKRAKKFLANLTFEERVSAYKRTREYYRWKNGWKRHCRSRAMIRRIGSRENAIKLGIVK